MKVEDAELLYKTKINWTAVYLENKLYCTEHGCEFFRKHLKQHFRIKDSKCDKCGLEFSSKWELNQHYKIHEGTIYSCLICNNYEASIKSTIGKHLKAKHAEIVGIHINWDTVQKYIKTIL